MGEGREKSPERKNKKRRKHKDSGSDTERKRERDHDHDHDRKRKHHKDKDRNKDKSGAAKKDKERSKSSRHEKKLKEKEKEKEGVNIMDEDFNDDDMWVEKNIDMDGEHPLATNIPTAESLKLKTSAIPSANSPPLPPSLQTESSLKRDDWMLEPDFAPAAPRQNSGASTAAALRMESESLTEDYGESSEGKRTLGGGVDFFSEMGTEHRKRPPQLKPIVEVQQISSRELNPMLTGHAAPGGPQVPKPPQKITPGGPGSSWRMMRLRRVYETVEEEGRPIEEVGIERFGTLAAFEEAKWERQVLDERGGGRNSGGGGGRGGGGGGFNDRGQGRGRDSGWGGRGGQQPNQRPTHYGTDGEKKIMFNDMGSGGSFGSAGSSRSNSFRRPGAANESRSGSGTATPSASGPGNAAGPGPSNRRVDSLRLPSQFNSPLSQTQTHTPVPSVFTPPVPSTTSSKRALSPSSLNKFQAKVLRAKMMNAPNAASLEKEYDEEMRRSRGEIVEEGGARVIKKVEVLPTLDARGRLYDVGTGNAGEDDEGPLKPGNRKKKEKFETHDPKTGEIIRYNADDDQVTLADMLRHEKFGAGIADQKDMDAQFAKAIMGDGKFQNDLEYLDENAEKLGRQKMRSDAMKRQFAIHDYKRTQKALSTCQFCYGEDDSLPKAPVIAMGSRAYLSCTTNDELVPGHCLIVPIQHHLSMLEGDDDVWDEVKNFMKCLMKMFAEEDKGVVFYETVLTLKWQKHTFIECVPLPWEQFDLIPGYFKESILMSETEWSQHKKLIDFSKRPGGFRRSMVPNLPYFMVQFDYKGEKGYGHVIEGTSGDGLEDEAGMDEGEKGSGEFPRWFAGEIIGNVLDIEARRWRRPRKVDFVRNKQRVDGFRKKYAKYDWTGMIPGSS